MDTLWLCPQIRPSQIHQMWGVGDTLPISPRHTWHGNMLIHVSTGCVRATCNASAHESNAQSVAVDRATVTVGLHGPCTRQHTQLASEARSDSVVYLTSPHPPKHSGGAFFVIEKALLLSEYTYIDVF